MKTKVAGTLNRNTFRGVKKEQIQHETNMCIASMTVSTKFLKGLIILIQKLKHTFGYSSTDAIEK